MQHSKNFYRHYSNKESNRYIMISFAKYTDELQSILKRIEITDRDGKILNTEEGFTAIISEIRTRKPTQKKVMIVGNGGSAAIASHLQNDLCKAVKVRAMVFTEIPLLTALSNDISYMAAYAEQISLFADSEDMLIAISSSGRSQNILDSVSIARNGGCYPIITLSGFLHDNPLRKIGDFNLYINSNEYGYVELAHSVLTHYISDQASRK